MWSTHGPLRVIRLIFRAYSISTPLLRPVLGPFELEVDVDIEAEVVLIDPIAGSIPSLPCGLQVSYLPS